MTYLYILESLVNGQYYIGVSDDPDGRLIAHNSGYNKSTRTYRPYKIIFQLAFETKALAMEREKKLKNLKSRKKIMEWIKKNGAGSIPEN
jgi:putative endonuclease